MYGSTQRLIIVKDRGEQTHYVTKTNGETSPLISDFATTEKVADLRSTDYKPETLENKSFVAEEGENNSIYLEKETLSFHQVKVVNHPSKADWIHSVRSCLFNQELSIQLFRFESCSLFLLL